MSLFALNQQKTLTCTSCMSWFMTTTDKFGGLDIWLGCPLDAPLSRFRTYPKAEAMEEVWNLVEVWIDSNCDYDLHNSSKL